MFLTSSKKSILVAFAFLTPFAQAEAKVEIKNFVKAGYYKLIAGPRESCGKLAIEESDLKDPFFIGAHYSFSLEDLHRIFPSEDNKDCQMNRRDKVQIVNPRTLILTHDREEVCQGQTKIQQRMEAQLEPGEVQLKNTKADKSSYTCVWKWRDQAVKEKK